MQLILKFVFIFTYNFILLFNVSGAENCLPLDKCESLNQLAKFQSDLQNITAESVESYIEEQRCYNTSDVLTYECPEIYDGEFLLRKRIWVNYLFLKGSHGRTVTSSAVYK